ncbi:transcription factor TFIIIB subunit brf1 [Thecaphora frezii]
MKCTNCGSLAIDYADNQAVCSQCGVVLEESQIVSEITFGETAGGGAMVQGSMLAADQGRARISGPAGFRGGFVSESREFTIANARGNINKMAGALRVPSHVADRALRFFTLALDGGSAAANGDEPKNYVLGRKAEYTTASCLYVACRMDKTTHMLIDFADAIQVNVFVLGRSYLKLVRVLNLKLPLIDPSIYISRFAALLDFGDETQRVAADASRLAARFKKDWLTEGRRPAGICGACLLLAARMNHFRRSISEVIQVVKIADITLRNRLEEFKKTPTGQLSVQDFRNVWLEEEYNPPAFLRAKESVGSKRGDGAKSKKKKSKDKDKDKGKKVGRVKRSKSAALEGEADEGGDEAEAKGENDEEVRGAAAALARGDGHDNGNKGVGDIDGDGAAVRQDNGDDNGERDPEADEETPIDPALESLVDQATEAEINMYLQEGIAKELDKTLEAQERARQERARQGLVDGSGSSVATSEADPDRAADLVADDAETANRDEMQIKLSQTQQLLPLGGLGMEMSEVIQGVGLPPADDRGEGLSRHPQGEAGEAAASPVRIKKQASEPPGADDLGDLDEEELDRFILSPDEVRIKERVWMEFNKDWLEAQLRKQLKMEHDQKNGIPIREPYKRKKPKAPRDASTATHQSAAESAKQMFKQKSFSKKINYDALNSLFPGAKRLGEGSGSGKKGSKARKRGRHESSDESDSSDDDSRRGRGRDKGKGKKPTKALSSSSQLAGEARDYFASDVDDEMEVVDEDASLPSSHPLLRRESRTGKKTGGSGKRGDASTDAGTDLGTELEDEDDDNHHDVGGGGGEAGGDVEGAGSDDDMFARMQGMYRVEPEAGDYFEDGDGIW